MKKQIALYPTANRYKRKVVEFGKKRTVPNQSMSLQEIIKRFMRKEALPIEKEAHYEDRFGDLEKLSREDITIRHERAEQLKTWADKRSKDYEEKQKREADEKAKKDEEEFVRKVKVVKGEPPVPPDNPKP